MSEVVPARPRLQAVLGAAHRWRAAVAVAAVAFLVGWLGTSSRVNALINWDNGAYITVIASGRADWTGSPGLWNAHLGILHVYLLGYWLVRPLGGTVIDGLRFATALYYAAACVILYVTARRLTNHLLLSIGFAAVWATAWVNFHYLLILEDNPLFLAPAAGLICLCIVRADDWRVRDSLWAGALVCAAFLGSWQALPYLFSPVYTALLTPGQSLRARAAKAALVVGGALATMIGWIVFVVATSRETFAQLFGTVFSRPEPSGLPHTLSELSKQLIDVHSIVETIGNALAYHVTFNAYKLPSGPPLPLLWLGAIATVVLLILWTLASLWSWRARRSAPHVLATTLLLFTYMTALYHDVGYTALKRFDFAPLLLVGLALFFYGELQRRRPSSRRDGAVAVALLLTAMTLAALGLRWSARTRASYVTDVPWGAVTHSPNMAYGRDGKSWFDYFRTIRLANPTACRYVFSLAELHNGNWNLDITGSLWSELPRHLAIATDAQLTQLQAASWRFKVSYKSVEQARAQSLILPCAWISNEARALLATNH